MIVDPKDYGAVLEELSQGEVKRETKFRFAQKVFEHTAHYDALIASYLRKQIGVDFPDTITFTYEKAQDLRYGENPHQKAVFYKEIGDFSGTIVAAEQLWGKELSYNNINDANGALDTLKEFGDIPCAVAVKHANPCGVGIGQTILDAYKNAYDADPVSIFGGIVALNRCCDHYDSRRKSRRIFLKLSLLRTYTDEALEIFETEKEPSHHAPPGNSACKRFFDEGL